MPRKRRRRVGFKVNTPYRRPRRTAAAKPGYTRTGGYYGRFNKVPSNELKFWDVPNGSGETDDAVVAAGGSILLDSCNKLAQGITESTRVGRKAIIKSINWRYDVTLPNAQDLSSTSDIVRVIMYLDKQCNGAVATVTGILESSDYQSFNNLANKGRFRILYDKTHVINAMCAAWDGTTEQTGAYTKSSAFYKKCNIPLEFDNTTGAITEIKSNNLGIMLVGKAGVAGFESQIRIRFVDG